MKRLRLAVYGVALLAGLMGAAAGALAEGPGASGDARPIVIVPIDGTVDDGMAHLVQRAVAQAEHENAAALVLDVNTPGGLLAAAFDIRDAVKDSTVPTVAYVSERAYSAGALITLASKKIIMSPGSAIGAAEPIPNDAKHVSGVRGDFEAIANWNKRDPKIAAAMVDKNVDLPAYKKSGAILTLTAEEALRAHIADGLAPTLAAALQTAHVPNGPHEEVGYSFGELVARFATTPEISGILLSIGVLGLIIEMQTLHGIAGTIGIGALALFFGTHVYAGFANPVIVALALAGIIGILLEFHVIPGHGVAGVLGAVALVTAILLAFGFEFILAAGIQAIAIAIVLSFVGLLLSTRVFPESAFFKRIALQAVQGADYVASRDFTHLVGHSGFATSLLRPAGVASIDGKRVDVLTEGDFLPAGSPIVVTRVEGARIFVHPA